MIVDDLDGTGHTTILIAIAVVTAIAIERLQASSRANLDPTLLAEERLTITSKDMCSNEYKRLGNEERFRGRRRSLWRILKGLLLFWQYLAPMYIHPSLQYSQLVGAKS